jgi:hypothetical protein
MSIQDRRGLTQGGSAATDADLLACIDSTYTALVDAYQHRRGLPDDVRFLLCDAFIVLAVVSAILRRKKHLNGKGRRP